MNLLKILISSPLNLAAMAVKGRGMAASSYKTVTHCIFDMDGLLLDTETIYTKVCENVAKAYGKTFTWELKQMLMGLQSKAFAKTMVDKLQLPITTQEFQQKFAKTTNEMMTDVKLMPGAKSLICHMHANNVPTALATSAGKDIFKVKTINHRDVFALLCHCVCGSTDAEVKAGKPAPDIFLVAASRFADKPDPCKCLVFEDSPNGVQAAISAGMQCVMVPDERMSTEQTSKATMVLKSLEDFQPELFGLPPFPKISC